MKFRLRIFLLLSWLPLISLAQRPIEFKNLSINEGLSQSIVFCIGQDSEGYMWFGTEDGLNRYDGYDFNILRNEQGNPNSLSGNGVVAFLEDSKGLLWVGTYGDGVNIYDRKSGEIRRFYNRRKRKDEPKHKEQGFKGSLVVSIFEDSQGMVWVGTASALNRYDPATQEFVHYPNVSGDPTSTPKGMIRGVLEDAKGNLWVGSQGGSGLSRFDRETETFIYYGHKEDDPQSLSNDNVIDICLDSKQQLWLGSYGGGLDRVDLTTYESTDTSLVFEHFRHDPNDPNSLSKDRVAAIHEDIRGDIWIGTHNGGLNKLIGGEAPFYRYSHMATRTNSLADNTVYAINEDRTGALWFGTREGLSQYDPGSDKFLTYRQNPHNPSSLSDNNVRGITTDNEGNLWLGTSGEGLDRLELSTGIFTHYKHDPNVKHSLQKDNIGALIRDQKGNIWIGSDGKALCRYDHASNSFTTFPQYGLPCPMCLGGNRVKTLFEDLDGSIWLGSAGGLSKFSIGDDSLYTFKGDPLDETALTSLDISFIAQSRDSVIWVGTAKNGFNKYDKATNTFTRYQHDPKDSTSLPEGRMRCIMQASDGYIWIGSLGGGLIRFDPEKEAFKSWRMSSQGGESLDQQEGLPNDIVYGILEDDHGNLWMSTNKGISKFNLADETFRNYDVTDGLQGNEFTSRAFHKAENGVMVFGGIAGLNVFHPDSIKDNKLPPQIVINKFSLFNQEVEPGKDPESKLAKPINFTDTLYLSYKDYVFSFEFAALHYGMPEKNQYAYQMVGFENDWNYVGTRKFVTYTNLDPGVYTFRVKGSNSDGVWSEEDKSIYIVISPPFWQTWWFRILVVILVVASVIAYILLREASLKKQRALLQENVRIKTKQLRRQKEEIEEKNRDITDSIEYASNIQNAILPKEEEMARALPENFVFFAPRDIVSGDFYWFAEKKDRIFVAACDCTGHGVPGAFLSMIGNDLLNQLIIEKDLNDPGEILSQLNNGIKSVFTREGEEQRADGMDMTLAVFKKDLTSVECAGAQNSIYLFRKTDEADDNFEEHFTINEQAPEFMYREIKGDRHPIGGRTDIDYKFTNRKIELSKDDAIYLYSDGFQDQFGGVKAKKFTRKRFLEMLLRIQNIPMSEQKQELESSFKKWQGEEEQLDDVLVIGIKS